MVDRIYGSLEFVTKEKKKFWKITGAQPVILIRRIIPSAGFDETGCAIIPDNKSNQEYIEWLMMKFKLEIKAEKEWDKKIKELHDYKKRLESIRELKGVDPKASFRGKLYDFQKEGLDFLMKTGGYALLADEMGLGKTVQALAYLATDEETLPALIVSPVVTLYNWKNEIEKFMIAKAESGLFKGREISPRIEIIRKGKRSQIPDADFYVINYELLAKRIDDLAEKDLRTIIGDEIQNIRNKETMKYQGLKEASQLSSVRHVIGLSGTPIYNRGSEIWPIVDTIQEGILGTWNEFVKTYCWIDNRDRAIVHEDMRDAIKDRLRETIFLRRKKLEVLKDLKEKITYQEIIETDSEFYEREIKRLYTTMLTKKREAKTELEKFHAYREMERNERKIAGMAKLPFVVKFVRDLMELEESIVVFCHHHDIHDSLYRQLYTFDPARIRGDQTPQERQRNIDRFQSKDTRLMIAGLRAGNVGINLTSANYVIHAELDWTPAIHRQAEDRLHRIGQKNTVFSYYLIGRGTLDERIAGVLVDKKLEIDAIMGDSGADEPDTEKGRAVLNYIKERLKDHQDISEDDSMDRNFSGLLSEIPPQRTLD